MNTCMSYEIVFRLQTQQHKILNLKVNYIKCTRIYKVLESITILLDFLHFY